MKLLKGNRLVAKVSKFGISEFGGSTWVNFVGKDLKEV